MDAVSKASCKIISRYRNNQNTNNNHNRKIKQIDNLYPKMDACKSIVANLQESILDLYYVRLSEMNVYVEEGFYEKKS